MYVGANLLFHAKIRQGRFRCRRTQPEDSTCNAYILIGEISFFYRSTYSTYTWYTYIHYISICANYMEHVSACTTIITIIRYYILHIYSYIHTCILPPTTFYIALYVLSLDNYSAKDQQGAARMYFGVA